MPGMDGTGPQGEGPLTGRGLGPCGRGLGFRRGFSSRSGWRRVGYEPVQLSKEEEQKILEAELKQIDLEKQEIEKRIKKIKK